MAFWSTNLSRGCQIDSILDKEDVTLNEILEQAEVIQECKAGQNKKLIDFLTRTDILTQLLDLILQEPDASINEKTRYKLPNVASEIITCDVKQINEKLCSDTSMLDKLYNFVDTGESELNPLLTSFFSKVFTVFFTRRSEQDYYTYQFTCYQVVEYIKSKPNFLGLLLNHIHVSAILDLLLRLIKCVEGESKKEILNWLNEGNLIQRCIQMFASPASTPQSPQKHQDDAAEMEADNVKTSGDDVEMHQDSEQPKPQPTDQGNSSPGEKSECTQDSTEPPSEQPSEQSRENTLEDKSEEAEVKSTEELKSEEQTSEKLETEECKEEGYLSEVSSSTEQLTSEEESLKLRDMHDNIGQLLTEIITGSRDFMLSASANERIHNSLLVTAESRQVCESLIDVMLLSPARESVIVNIVSVLLCLLEVRKAVNIEHGYTTNHEQTNAQTAADIQHQEDIVLQTVQILTPRLPAIVELLQNPPMKPSVLTTAGAVNPPFGASRLAMCKLLSQVLATKKIEVNTCLAKTSLLNTQLDLFFKYSLNNFLHSQTENVVRSILEWEPTVDLNKTAEINEPNTSSTLQTPKVEKENVMESSIDDELNCENPLLIQLFTEARLFSRLVDAWEGWNDDPKISYMGHITQISNLVVTCMKEKEGELPAVRANRITLNQIYQKLPEELRNRWESVVSNNLTNINSKNEIKSYRDKHSSDDDSDFRDIQFPQDTTLAQRFSNYCMQLMNDNLEDTFGFTSEEFNDTEETYGKMTASDSCLVVTDQTKKAIFEKICSARGSYESDDEEDIWADKTAQITFGNPVPSKTKVSEMEEHSSDEEAAADQAVPADTMEVDQDPWSGDIDCGAVAMDTSAPWDAQAVSSPSSQGEAGGWAAFDKPASTTETQQGEGWASFDSSGGGGGGGEANSTDDGNWADFSALNAAGGEGFDGSSAPRPVDNKEKGEDWRPAMSSSPEATMLDQFDNPLLNEDRSPFRPESPDLSNYNANQEAPTTKFQHQQAKAMEESKESGEINNANNEHIMLTESADQKTADAVLEKSADEKTAEITDVDEKSADGEEKSVDVQEKSADVVQEKSADVVQEKSTDDVEDKSADEASAAGSDGDKDKSSVRLEGNDGEATSEA